MRCPNCYHQQNGGDSCESCGVIFVKFYLRRKRLQEAKAREKVLSQKKTLKESLISKFTSKKAYVILGGTVIFFVLFASFRAYYFHKKRLHYFETLVAKENITIQRHNKESIIKTLSSYNSPKTPIEKARNATVFIESAVGAGSGFFIDNYCHIITNRHVIDMSDEEYEQLREETSALEFLVSQEKRMLGEVYYEQDDPHKVQKQDVLTIKQRQLRENEHALREMKKKLKRLSSESTDKKTTIILVNGQEFTVYDVQMSDTYDLALLTILGVDSPHLRPNTEMDIPHGARLLTVGNPSGLRHTVTSGIFSGFQDYGGDEYIQTDAPINPGNSGGPLIDESGMVVGINTMILNNTEGIGFAIPISVVYEAFPSLSKKR